MVEGLVGGASRENVSRVMVAKAGILPCAV